MNSHNRSENPFSQFNSTPKPVQTGCIQSKWALILFTLGSVGLAAGVAYWMQPKRLDPNTPRLVLKVDGMH